MGKSLRSDPKCFAAHPETTSRHTVALFMNGADYLESRRDGRKVFIYRNTARMMARLNEALHDPDRQNIFRL